MPEKPLNKEGAFTAKDIEERISSILFFKPYRKFVPAMLRTLVFSRIRPFNKQGKYLLFLQKVMAYQLRAFQSAIQEGKKLLKNEVDPLKIKDITKRIETHKQLARIMQVIADGIAWRNIGFQRPIMRLLSENASPGYIDKEMGIIQGLTSNGVIIINDLTHFCRIGDFTRIFPDGKIIIYEAKTSKDVTRLYNAGDILSKATGPGSPKITVQERRHILVQNAIINRKIDIPIFKDSKLEKSLEVEIVDLDIAIETHYKKLDKLISDAQKRFISSMLVEDGYLIKVTDYESLERLENNTEDKIKMRHEAIKASLPDWVKNLSEDVILFDSYHAFFEENKQFTRNILPYSVFPLKNKYITKMMFGYLRVKVYLNLNWLEKLLKERGWEVERIGLDQFKVVETDRVMFIKEHIDTVLKVSRQVEGGIYATSISLTELLHMISSFYTTDFLLDSLDQRHILAMARKFGKLKIAPNYLKEKEILV